MKKLLIISLSLLAVFFLAPRLVLADIGQLDFSSTSTAASTDWRQTLTNQTPTDFQAASAGVQVLLRSTNATQVQARLMQLSHPSVAGGACEDPPVFYGYVRVSQTLPAINSGGVDSYEFTWVSGDVPNSDGTWVPFAPTAGICYGLQVVSQNSIPVAIYGSSNPVSSPGQLTRDNSWITLDANVKDAFYNFGPPIVLQAPTINALQQLKSDAATLVAEGATTTEDTAMFSATPSSPEDRSAKLQIELRQFAEPFTGNFDGGIAESAFVPSGTAASVTRSGLADGQYKWRARAMDDQGTFSDWQEFGTVGNVDFVVQTARTIKVAVILAEPEGSDFAAGRDKVYFENEIIPKMKDYWCEVSFGTRASPTAPCENGLVELDFTVLDDSGQNFVLDKTIEEYAENTRGPHGVDINDDGTLEIVISSAKDQTEQFVWDAMAAAGIASGDYQIAVAVHPGHREEVFAISEPHRLITEAWGPEDWGTYVSSAPVQHWAVVAEEDQLREWAHELGHRIGFLVNDVAICDLYKQSSCQDGGSLGEWDLMAGSLFEKLLSTDPAHLSSFNKIKLGWLREEVVGFGTHAIESLETTGPGEMVARYNFPDGVYYLLEARTDDPFYSRWDVNVPETALVIYKISPSTTSGQPVKYVNVASALEGVGAQFIEPVRGFSATLMGFQSQVDSFQANVQLTAGNYADVVVAFYRQDDSLLERIWGFGGPLRVDESVPVTVVGPQEDWLPGFPEALPFVYGFLVISALALVILWRKDLFIEKRNRKLFLLVLFLLVSIILALLVFLPQLLGMAFAGDREAPTSHSAFGSPVGIDDGQVLPDLDLHAYTSDGLHVGMNYSTGDYEIQIPGASASGDLWSDEEWIVVPVGTEVRFAVSSRDIEQFFQEHPDIAASLPSLEEAYTFGAITYDASSQRFAATPVENITVNPGETRVHIISGTIEEPTVDEGVVDDTGPAIAHISLDPEYLLNTSPFAFTYSAEDTLSGAASVSATLDGQPFASGSVLSFTVPGPHAIVLTAQDNAGNTTTETITFAVVYDFGGFFPPVKADGSGIYKQGRTLPVKFRLTDANDQSVSTATAHLFLAKITDGIIGTEEVALSISAADTGNLFRVSGDQYMFNLSTDTMTSGTWQLRATLDDGTSKIVLLSLRQ
ncbi:MAG: hypothetical protein A2991_04205 [Candidatus Terrybacteria bacterium RIFCSPLOWO2_01_FULL_58_14]|uniref:Bacterial Ig-like domain-containing protein n=1 Tax=Candidatus Terrybacteria bacterium RIFCSPLOWO2_01_FULL_58_14 TaxID=1802369 RepID=A0A1G2PXI8_9BACT|nr:MAG: hypothetical protein A2991_04205 [Candidatus Terrybacteria bacterium RIFCSPLOWO2_01_FULL_58_14]